MEQTEQTKEKEVKLLNIVLAALALGCLAVAGWDVVTSRFKGGTDDLFLILTCLLLALIFAINPLIWAYSKGLISNPFKADEEEALAAAAEAAHEAHGGSNRENVVVWGGLLVLTAIEVVLAYIHLDQTLMLIILMLLSIVKAALIVAYFMHLKFERLSFVLTIVPVLVVLLCLFGIFFPDGKRVDSLRHPAAQEKQAE
jgi:cytochrome c oxidase subunit IV